MSLIHIETQHEVAYDEIYAVFTVCTAAERHCCIALAEGMQAWPGTLKLGASCAGREKKGSKITYKSRKRKKRDRPDDVSAAFKEACPFQLSTSCTPSVNNDCIDLPPG